MTFLRGFGFFKVGRPKVRLAKHIPIVRFQYYRYQFSLEYPARPGLVQALTSISKQTRVINSAYGNPYQCRITNFRFRRDRVTNQQFVFSFGGEARKIPILQLRLLAELSDQTTNLDCFTSSANSSKRLKIIEILYKTLVKDRYFFLSKNGNK